MNIAIRYHSRSGNTRKLAEAIGKELRIPAETIQKPLGIPVDLLFVGSGLYAGSPDRQLMDFLERLTPDMVKKVVVFTTAAGNQNAYDKIKVVMEKEGIPVVEKHFHCRAKFLFLSPSRPNSQDIKDVIAFAKEMTQLR